MDILFDFEETDREPTKNDLMRHMDYLEKIWLNVDSQKHWAIGPNDIQDLICDNLLMRNPALETHENTEESKYVPLQQERAQHKTTLHRAFGYANEEEVKYKARKRAREIADEFAKDKTMGYLYTIGPYGIQDLMHDNPEVKDHLPETEVQEEMKEKECVLLQQEHAQKKRAFHQAVQDEEVEEIKYKARKKAWNAADEFAEDIAEDYLDAEEIIRFEKKGGVRKGKVKQQARGKGQTKRNISPIVKSELAKLERCYIKSEEAARRLVRRR